MAPFADPVYNREYQRAWAQKNIHAPKRALAQKTSIKPGRHFKRVGMGRVYRSEEAWRKLYSSDPMRYYQEYNKRVKDPVAERKRLRTIDKSLREQVFDLLGSVCKRCRFSDRRALQIDHINGDGHKDNRPGRKGRNTSGLPRRILNDPLAKTRYQILCANCNWIKRHEKQEYLPAIRRNLLIGG